MLGSKSHTAPLEIRPDLITTRLLGQLIWSHASKEEVDAYLSALDVYRVALQRLQFSQPKVLDSSYAKDTKFRKKGFPTRRPSAKRGGKTGSFATSKLGVKLAKLRFLGPRQDSNVDYWDGDIIDE